MVEVVLGPPGTGKTTTLVGIVEGELAAGTLPERIGYVSFTKRAANEAIERACERFNIRRADLPFFRTLHSMCFKMLGLSSGEVLEGKQLQRFGESIGCRITGRWTDDGTFSGFDLGDRLLYMYNLARVRRISVEEQYAEDTDGLAWQQVQRFVRSYDAYKRENHLVDYTGMMEQFLQEECAPPLDVLVVDEAQDLSHIQWLVVALLSRAARRVCVAGDDDQAIFRFAGADVEHLIRLGGTTTVLGQSYRVPPAVQVVANSLTPHMGERRSKDWAPRTGVEGQVERVRGANYVDFSGGQVLVLARNSYILYDHVVPELRRQGVIWERDGHPSVRPAMIAAIRDWEALRAGRTVQVGRVLGIYDEMSSGVGVRRGYKTLPGLDPELEVSIGDLRDLAGLMVDGPWYEAMDRLPEGDVNYLRAALAHGESLAGRPRVRLSTIHGAKGGEADHVVLMTEVATRTFREMDHVPKIREDEARVWYVGVTRAKERLTVVGSQTARACPWI